MGFFDFISGKNAQLHSSGCEAPWYILNKIIMKKFIILFVFSTIIAVKALAMPEKGSANDSNLTEAEFPGGYDELYEWVSANAKYPVAALESNVSTDVMALFDISEDGAIDDIRLFVEGYPEFDYEINRLISLMPRWIPAKKGRQAVRDTQSLAFIFDAEETKRTGKTQIKIAVPIVNEELSPLEIMTQISERKKSEFINYPGVNSADTSHIKYCYTEAKFQGGIPALMQWLSENINYPEVAYNNGIEDHIVVKFEVYKDGTVGNAELTTAAAHPLLEAEALRVVLSMPRWIPVTMDGMPFNSYFHLPISFKIPR